MTTLAEFTADGTDHGRVMIRDGSAVLAAAPRTDWFFKPDGSGRASNVLRLGTRVDAPAFSLVARVQVGFAATYDAGALFIACDRENWAKLAFEFSAAGRPTIVSVVTRSTSDDADGPSLARDSVWLRLYCDGRIVALHFSEDGRTWRFVRVFTLPGIEARPIEVGLGVQSPTGNGVEATFSDVALVNGIIANLRDGS